MALSPTRSRLVRGLCVLTAAGTLAALAATPALGHPSERSSSAMKPVVAGSRYLALGDSVVFGYREDTNLPIPNYAHPKSFVGFPEDVGANLGLKVTNAACPGETTASLISASAQSNGCENTPLAGKKPQPGGYRTAYPLHVKYKSAKQSQLAFAEAFLKAHPNTRLVSLMVGANDGFICLEETSDDCVSELGGVLATITKNVKTILRGIRNTAHYSGQLVIVTYYSTNYADSFATIESHELNLALANAAKGFHVKFADGFGLFQKAAAQDGGNTCTAQLVTALSGADAGTCGVHPSVAGQALLAQAVEQAITK